MLPADMMFPEVYIEPTTNQVVQRQQLPRELQIEILSYLELQNLPADRIVSKCWDNVIRDGQLWQRHLKSKYNQNTIAEAEGIDRVVLGVDSDTYMKHKDTRAYNIYMICNLLSFYKLKGDAIKNLLLAQKGRVYHLDLNGGKISSSNVRVVATVLRYPKCEVNSLDLSDNLIGPVDIQNTIVELLNRRKFIEVDLANNPIGDVGVEHLIQILMSQNCPEILNLGSTQISTDGLHHLAHALLHENCCIRKLSLYDNKIDVVNVAIIAALFNNPSCPVTDWDLSHNQLGDDGLRQIAEALIRPNKVTKLNLDNNGIGNVGAGYFAQALMNKNCHIEKLDLDFNEIDDDGKRTLAQAIVQVERFQGRKIQITGIEDFDRFLAQAQDK